MLIPRIKYTSSTLEQRHNDSEKRREGFLRALGHLETPLTIQGSVYIALQPVEAAAGSRLHRFGDAPAARCARCDLVASEEPHTKPAMASSLARGLGFFQVPDMTGKLAVVTGACMGRGAVSVWEQRRQQRHAAACFFDPHHEKLHTPRDPPLPPGGNSGIGLEVVKSLAARNATVGEQGSIPSPNPHAERTAQPPKPTNQPNRARSS
jgi:hypothetical protein